MSSKGNCWNSENTCTYRQTIAVNPLVGGFSPYEETLEESKFTSYQFFGTYKVSAQNNQVIIYTTDSCSQMSVTFDFACVIFQAKVEPQKRNTQCKQVVDFQEQEYSIEINPFIRQTVEVGLVIFAAGNNLNFSNINLKSLTNEEIISVQLHEIITERLPVIIEDEVQSDPNTRELLRSIKVPLPTPVTPFGFRMTPVQPLLNTQTITIRDPTLAQRNTFLEWQVRNEAGNTILFKSSPETGSSPWSVSLATNKKYRIGFSYRSSTNKILFYAKSITVPISTSGATLTPWKP